MARSNNSKRRTTKRLKVKRDTAHVVPKIGMGRELSYGFPSRLLTKLRYCDTLQISSSAGALAKYLFRMNSTFDPDLTGSGHQPLYRDQFAGVYDHYSVVSSTAVVKLVNNTSGPIHCGLLNEDDGTASTSYNVLMEQNHGVHALLPAQAGSVSSITFNYAWDCVKILGIDPYTSETYKTAVGSDPTEDSTLVVWFQPVDLSSTVSTYFQIEIEYTVLWTELTTPTIS